MPALGAGDEAVAGVLVGDEGAVLQDVPSMTTMQAKPHSVVVREREPRRMFITASASDSMRLAGAAGATPVVRTLYLPQPTRASGSLRSCG